MATDKQQAESGKVVKFGTSQLGKPTPQTAKVIFRVLLYVSAVWAMVAPSITEISPESLASINKYLLLGNGVVNLTIKFFGWTYVND